MDELRRVRRGSQTKSLEPIPRAIPQHRQHQRRHSQQLATGKLAMLEPGEQIKSLRLTGDGFGDEAAGDTGEGDAVA